MQIFYLSNAFEQKPSKVESEQDNEDIITIPDDFFNEFVEMSKLQSEEQDFTDNVEINTSVSVDGDLSCIPDHIEQDSCNTEDEDSTIDESEPITTSDQSESEVETDESSSTISSQNSELGDEGKRKEDFEQSSTLSDKDSAQG